MITNFLEFERYCQCRARRASGPGMVYCLSPNSKGCEHLGNYDGMPLCLHPSREDIIAKTMERESRGS